MRVNSLITNHIKYEKMPFNRMRDNVDVREDSKVLYFPYINVPNNAWFNQILLYWDEVGAIVPQDYIFEPQKLESHMREYVEAGLVTQIIPYFSNWEKRNNYTNSFIQLIEKYKLNQKANGSKYGPVYATTRIHVDKFSCDILDYLIREKLATADTYPWYRVESTTAGLFMTYLATVLGNSDELNMKPITDNMASFSTFSEEYAKGDNGNNLSLDHMKIDILEDILPVPQYINKVDSLIQFKERYGDLLPNLRRKIDLKIQELSYIENENERDFHIRKFRLSVKEEIAELAAKMEERNWGGILFGTVCVIGAAAIPGAKALIENDYTSGLGALPGVMGAVYTAYSGYRNKQKSIISSPYAYAAYVKREFK